VHLRVERTDTPFTGAAHQGETLKIPIAHNEGNYFCDPATLAELERDNRIIFRYVHPDGTDCAEAVRGDAASLEFDRENNPNGSLRAIAGICSQERNVLGLMPHPERAVESPLGSSDGLVIFQSMVEYLTRGERKASGSRVAVTA
jgi:phosphoribosylformylglycinamidine synthase